MRYILEKLILLTLQPLNHAKGTALLDWGKVGHLLIRYQHRTVITIIFAIRRFIVFNVNFCINKQPPQRTITPLL